MIELKNVEKMFTETMGIKDINLTIGKKAKIGILGPNGAGKSTLIKLIQGLLIPKSGAITKNGLATSNKKFTLEDVAYISVDEIFPKNLSVKFYIKFIRNLNRNYQSNIDEIAKIFDFDLKQLTKMKNLSNGMKQKLKICLALGFNKEIYIFDEATKGLDPLMRDIFIEYINNNLQNKIIIYCTHLVEEATAICKEVLILKNNTIIEKIMINENTNLIKSYKEIYQKELVNEKQLSTNQI